ncbi:MAG TPA: hypothetical protein PLP25_02410 [Candidatus Limiplasma sp.]|nr:hypothetical protein [Candidatus Limiplasma sp.]HPS80699.1 hypothetical protein [Candidatus Limiplasma sp.]
MKKALIFVYFFLLTILTTWAYAFAYLDPSSMTYVIQIVAGVAIAASAGIGFYWKRIRRYFRRKKKERLERKADGETAHETDQTTVQ